MERQKTQRQDQQIKKQNTTRKLLIGGIIAAVILLAAIIVVGLGKSQEPEITDSIQPEESIYGDAYLGVDPQVDEALQDYRNVLLFGVHEDAEDEQGSAGDDFLIVSFHKDTDEMKMVSVDGRTYLKIDENKSDKVSAAYDTGGMDKLMKCLNQNLDLNIREGVALPWDMIEELVDEIGGIEMEISAGNIQTLNGQQAVEYATSEEGGKRMQEVLMAALQKAKTMKSEEVAPILDKVMPQIIQRNMNGDQTSALLMEMAVFDTAAGISWPYDATEKQQGDEILIIPETLQSNVTRLHAELFRQQEHEPIDEEAE